MHEAPALLFPHLRNFREAESISGSIQPLVFQEEVTEFFEECRDNQNIWIFQQGPSTIEIWLHAFRKRTTKYTVLCRCAQYWLWYI